MKRIFIVACGLVTQIAFAQLPFATIENFSASYANPQGSARADKFVYEDLEFGSSPEFDFYQQAGEFVLSAGGEEFRLGSLPQAVYDWESVSLDRVDLQSQPGYFEMKSERIDYVSNEGEAGHIGGVDLACKSEEKADLFDTFLDLCLNQKMYFFLPSISGVDVNSINVWADNNKLNFSLRKGVWIKGYGEIYYDAQEKAVKVKITKAKAGFFNVTGKLFSELKKHENEMIEVDRPWITIKVGSR